MRINIENPKFTKFVAKYAVKSTPRIILQEGSKILMDDSVDPMTPNIVKMTITKKRFNYLPDDAYLDIRPTDVEEQRKHSLHCNTDIAKPEPPKEEPKVEPPKVQPPKVEPPVVQPSPPVSQPLKPHSMPVPMQSLE